MDPKVVSFVILKYLHICARISDHIFLIKFPWNQNSSSSVKCDVELTRRVVCFLFPTFGGKQGLTRRALLAERVAPRLACLKRKPGRRQRGLLRKPRPVRDYLFRLVSARRVPGSLSRIFGRGPKRSFVDFEPQRIRVEELRAATS